MTEGPQGSRALRRQYAEAREEGRVTPGAVEVAQQLREEVPSSAEVMREMMAQTTGSGLRALVVALQLRLRSVARLHARWPAASGQGLTVREATLNSFVKNAPGPHPKVDHIVLIERIYKSQQGGIRVFLGALLKKRCFNAVPVAIKVVTSESGRAGFVTESENMLALRARNPLLAPRVYVSKFDQRGRLDPTGPPGLGVLVIEWMDGVVGRLVTECCSLVDVLDEVVRRTGVCLEQLQAHRFTHGDMHLNNLGFRLRGRPSTMQVVPIDFARGFTWERIHQESLPVAQHLDAFWLWRASLAEAPWHPLNARMVALDFAPSQFMLHLLGTDRPGTDALRSGGRARLRRAEGEMVGIQYRIQRGKRCTLSYVLEYLDSLRHTPEAAAVGGRWPRRTAGG